MAILTSLHSSSIRGARWVVSINPCGNKGGYITSVWGLLHTLVLSREMLWLENKLGRRRKTRSVTWAVNKKNFVRLPGTFSAAFFILSCLWEYSEICHKIHFDMPLVTLTHRQDLTWCWVYVVHRCLEPDGHLGSVGQLLKHLNGKVYCSRIIKINNVTMAAFCSSEPVWPPESCSIRAFPEMTVHIVCSKNKSRAGMTGLSHWEEHFVFFVFFSI